MVDGRRRTGSPRPVPGRNRPGSRGALASLLLLTVSSAFALGTAELLLRVMAEASGSLAPPEERRVVEQVLERGLQACDMFETDEHAIFKANPNFDFSRIPRFRGVRINPSGFRGPDFVPTGSTTTSVLFIGDSFTWGGAAMPIPGNCFVDIVAGRGYHVWNAGIPATPSTRASS
jgi:hypothetical protein